MIRSESYVLWGAADRLDPGNEPQRLIVRAVTNGPGRGQVVVRLGYRRVLTLDWSEADGLASMLSEAADLLYQEGRVKA
jgi:hypothetical protein